MNNFFSPDLIFFVMVAAFLIIRLRSVLGKRTGNEKKHGENISVGLKQINKDFQNKQLKEANNINKNLKISEDIRDKNIKSKINKLIELDPHFNYKEFLKGAKIAFERIVQNYSSGDVKKIKNILSPEIFKSFSNAAELRKKKKQVLEHTLISFKTAEIKDILFNTTIVSIVVKYVTEQVNTVKNAKGETIDGNSDYVENHNDLWTFSRNIKSSNPNWTLIVTETGK